MRFPNDSIQPTLYKVLTRGPDGLLHSCHGGGSTYDESGEWMPRIEMPRVCEQGYHLTIDPLSWWKQKTELWIAEGSADWHGDRGDKAAFASVRLLGRVTRDWRFLSLLPRVRAFVAASERSMDENTDIGWAVLSQVDLRRAVLVGAKLAGVNFHGTYLEDACLRDIDLRGSLLTATRLTDAELQNADLRQADLSAAVLRRTSFASARMSNAILVHTDLTAAYLRGADLKEANLRGATLTRADLSGADLTGANLRFTELTGTRLSDANLTGADLTGASTQQELVGLVGWGVHNGKLHRKE
jgi:uncharacterized protein YjbI with pentapeptide repeats